MQRIRSNNIELSVDLIDSISEELLQTPKNKQSFMESLIIKRLDKCAERYREECDERISTIMRKFTSEDTSLDDKRKLISLVSKLSAKSYFDQLEKAKRIIK